MNKSRSQKQKKRQDHSVNAKQVKQKPEWISSFADQKQYKLTPTEQMQRKVSLISKHKFEAKEEWNEVQSKLRSGIMDNTVSKIFETALSSKGLGHPKYDVTRRNLTQMMHLEDNKKSQLLHTINSPTSRSQATFEFEEMIENQNIIDVAKNLLKHSSTQENDKDFIKGIKEDLVETKQLLKKVTSHLHYIQIQVESCNPLTVANNPSRLIKNLKNISNKKEKLNKQEKENEKPSNLQRKTISNNTSSKKQISNDPSEKKIILQNFSQQPGNITNYSQQDKTETELNCNQRSFQFHSLNQIEDTMKFMNEIMVNKVNCSSFQVVKNSELFDKTSFIEPTNKTKILYDDGQRTEQRTRQDSIQINLLNEFIQQRQPTFENDEEDAQQTQFLDQTDFKPKSMTQNLEQVSPSKFFDFKPSIQEARTVRVQQLLDDNQNDNLIKSDQQEFMDLENLRNMLEQTRIELDRMNINPNIDSRLPSGHKQLKSLVNVDVNKNFLPFLPQSPQFNTHEEDIKPRSFNVTQYRLKDNIKQMSSKYRNKENSFNIHDHI